MVVAVGVGQVIAFADGLRMRREREGRARHVRCLEIIATAAIAARDALETAADGERAVWARRVRKLEELHAWAAGGDA
jgi:hypothetical protein